MKTGDACNRNVVCIEGDASVSDAARRMREAHVGDLVIVKQENGHRIPTAIITDRDLVLEVLATDLDADTVSIGDLFSSTDLITASVDDELESTIDSMWLHGIRRIPVMDRHGHLVGLVAMDDMLQVITEQLSNLVRLTKRQAELEAKRRL